MSTNNKGRNPIKDATPKTTSTSDFTPVSDPLAGWHALAANVKASRQRDLKKAWKRKQRGDLLIDLAMMTFFLSLAMLLMMTGGAV